MVNGHTHIHSSSLSRVLCVTYCPGVSQVCQGSGLRPTPPALAPAGLRLPTLQPHTYIFSQINSRLVCLAQPSQPRVCVGCLLDLDDLLITRVIMSVACCLGVPLTTHTGSASSEIMFPSLFYGYTNLTSYTAK